MVGLTLLRAHAGGLGSINYFQLQSLQYAYLFASGAVAITAMVLPGISGSSILLIAGVYLPTIQAVHSLMGLPAGSIAGAVHAGIWRAGGRGYIHQCYPRRAAKVPQPDDLADLGPDAWLTVRHRQRPRKFGHAAPGAEYGDLPACRLCVGRYSAAGAGRRKNDDGT